MGEKTSSSKVHGYGSISPISGNMWDGESHGELLLSQLVPLLAISADSPNNPSPPLSPRPAA
jgi:hypothetical protein